MPSLHIQVIPLLIIFGILWCLILIIYSLAKKPGKKSLIQEKQYLSELIDKYNETISQFNIQKAGAIYSAVFNKDSKSLHLIEEENSRFVAISDLCMQNIEQLRDYVSNRKTKPCKEIRAVLVRQIAELSKSLKFMTRLRSSLQDKGKKTQTDENKNSNNSKYKDNQSQQKTTDNQKMSADAAEGYFLGCKNKDDLEKRYKMLVKAFHPDTGYGDETLFKNMNTEYNKLKNELE